MHTWMSFWQSHEEENCVCARVYENSIYNEFNLQIFTPNARNYVERWWGDEVESEKPTKVFFDNQHNAKKF
jgi:hypothetical protein